LLPVFREIREGGRAFTANLHYRPWSALTCIPAVTWPCAMKLLFVESRDVAGLARRNFLIWTYAFCRGTAFCSSATHALRSAASPLRRRQHRTILLSSRGASFAPWDLLFFRRRHCPRLTIPAETFFIIRILINSI
jgi:hypothetical protein